LSDTTTCSWDIDQLRKLLQGIADYHTVAAPQRGERERPTNGSPAPVGAELAIHGGDLRHRWTVVVRHDRRSWRYDCYI
jgi:hypothetical protein